MATGRMLSRKISANKDIPRLVRLVDERLGQPHGAFAALLFTWLIAHLDAEGRTSGDPDVVKGNVAPRMPWITSDSVHAYLMAAAELKLVEYYEADGDSWLAFPGFDRNQPWLRKDREAASQIPSPDSGVSKLATPDQLRSNSGVTPALLPPKVSEVKVSKVIVREPRAGAVVRRSAATQEQATALLAELSAARRRIDPKARELSPIPANLRHISERLSEGASVDDVRHVIAVCEAECKAIPTAFQWFDAVSPFRADNFARKIARDARTTVTATAQSRVAEPAKPPQVPLIDVEAIRREREERLRAENADTRRRFEAGELSEQELRWAIQGGVVSAEEARANGRR